MADCGRSSVVEPQISKLAARVRSPPPASSDAVDRLLSVVKTAERNEARRLRREEGRSVKELAALLGVARSSISLWVRDIELTKEQHAALRRRMGGRIDGSRVNAVISARSGERERKRAVGDELDERILCTQPVACCSGRKGPEHATAVEFVNSDPAMIDPLRSDFFDPATACLMSKVRGHVQPLRRSRSWPAARSRTSGWICLACPGACLRKSTVNRYSKYSKKKRRNKLPYGTCRLTVCDTQARSEPLRGDPGVRRLRARGMAHVAQ